MAVIERCGEMDHFIPLSVPNFKGNELVYVTEAIKTEWVSTSGSYIVEFENKIASYVQSKGAVACQSGTSGLHVALMVCGIEAYDEVIVPTLTFIAAVNPVRYCRAEPIFMDCDDTLCMDSYKLEAFCTNECRMIDGILTNNLTHRPIKAIIVVHIFGNMANMEHILEISLKFNLKVIEDATEALGTYYTKGLLKGKYAGTMGTIGVYSFNGNKIITTGGGGMIVSDDEHLLVRSKYMTTQAKSDEVYYTHDEVGYNYRMTNLQAALGLAQLEQLEQFIDVKKKNYDLYKSYINKVIGLEMLSFIDSIRSNYWFYSVKIQEQYPMNRDELIQRLDQNHIQSRPIWGLINEQKPYRNNQHYKIEKAKYYLNSIINIPCSSGLTEEELMYVVECIERPNKMGEE